MEARLPTIKNVVTLQTMMRALGKDVPLDLKRKLEVSLDTVSHTAHFIEEILPINQCSEQTSFQR